MTLPDDLTFIRPLWLLLLFAPFLLLVFKQMLRVANPWTKYVDKNLLPYLLVQKKTPGARRLFWIFALVWSMMVIALAGPAIGEKQTPGYLSTDSTVIIADLSQTLSDSSLIKMKSKLHDALGLLKNDQTALVLYDSKGYILTPLTADKNILRNIIPTLSPLIMPGGGNNPVKGFERAATLFKNVGLSSGRILFVTTGDFDAAKLVAYTKTLPYKTAILLIPQPGIVPDMAALQTVDAIKTWTLTDGDLKNLFRQTRAPSLQIGTETGRLITAWDLGPFVLLATLPFFLYFFRRGVLFVLILAIALPAHAGLFKRADQESYAISERAVAAYHATDFERAKRLFQQNIDANSLYNAGNAAAFAGDIETAISLYARALALDSNHADAAFNKTYLESQFPPASADSDKPDNANPSQNASLENAPSSVSDKKSDRKSGELNETESPETSMGNDSEKMPIPEPATPGTGDASTASLPAHADSSAERPSTPLLSPTLDQDPSRLIRWRLNEQYRKQP